MRVRNQQLQMQPNTPLQGAMGQPVQQNAPLPVGQVQQMNQPPTLGNQVLGKLKGIRTMRDGRMR